MRVSIRPQGVETEAGPFVVYDVEGDKAHFGAARVDGRAIVWEIDERPEGDWLIRCDRVDFPPGGVAYLHTHPGPGIRVLLIGRIRIDSGGESHEYRPFEWWYESGPEPVFAAASPDEETAFVRVMLVPGELEGKRTIRYVDPADEERRSCRRRASTSSSQSSGDCPFQPCPRDSPSAVSGEDDMTRTGGQVLVDQLELHGVEIAFCVPGESYLAVLDALHDASIRLISCRHEAAAANMAEAYGKMTGRPGICLVTRGPGATHASIGVHIAKQDSSPVIVLVGQVPRSLIGRDSFQEVDYERTFGDLAKWVAQADDAARLPELLARAFAVASSGRPGPVVLALPEDVLVEETDASDAAPTHVPHPQPSADDLRRLRELLAGAERPIVIVGEGGWTAAASDGVLVFCEANELPVVASFRCQDYVDNRSPTYAGHLTLGPDPNLVRRMKEADLVLAIGGRLGDITTQGYTVLEVPRPKQTLVHAHPDPNELGRVYEADLPIVSDLTELSSALAGLEPVDASRWREWTKAARSDYLANLQHRELPGQLDLAQVVAFLRTRLPDDAMFTCGAGNFAAWAHRFYEYSRYGTQLAPRAGAMGYGLPAALAAKAVHPERIVVCLAGDGDFMMSASELATAVQYDLPVIVLVVNNGMYGTIRMHQERNYPGRVVGTRLVNPEFADFARSFGCHGETVERTDEFEDAFERAVASGAPAVLDLRVDPDAIHPRFTIAELRASK